LPQLPQFSRKANSNGVEQIPRQNPRSWTIIAGRHSRGWSNLEAGPASNDRFVPNDLYLNSSSPQHFG